MSDYLVAVDETKTRFLFDRQATIAALVARWPDAVVDEEPVPGSWALATISLPTADPAHRDPVVEWLTPGDGLGIQIGDTAVAAEVLAVICATQPVPDDGSVVIIHWADDYVPLAAGITAEELIAVAR